MLKQTKFILLLLALCTGSLFAYPHPCPGSFTVEADYLYLFPTVDDTFFVVNSPATDVTSGTRVKNDFHFHSGFRVGGAYAFCDCERDFQVYYTRLFAKQSKTVRGPLLSASTSNGVLAVNFAGYTGSASSNLGLLYQRVDGFVDQHLFCICGVNVYLQGGFEFAYLRLNERYTYRIDGVPTPGIQHERSKTWGIGPQFGFETDYNLCQFTSCLPGTLSLVACSSGSLLVSKTERRSLLNNVTLAGIVPGATSFNLHDNSTWRCIPAFHARVGLNYATCFSCFGASLEIGYEFNTYVRGLARLIHPAVASNTSSTNYYNFDVQGLYVAADFTF